MTKNIEASMIFEILGRPVEYVKESLAKVIDNISAEKGIKLKKKVINDPKKMENKDKDGNILKVKEEHQLYTSFAEVELEADNIFDFLNVVFKYLPSHIEIVSPNNIEFSNIDFSSLNNEIIRRLHHYDAIAKSALMNNQILANKMEEMKKMFPQQTAQSQRSNAPLEISYGNKEEKKEVKTKTKKGKKK